MTTSAFSEHRFLNDFQKTDWFSLGTALISIKNYWFPKVWQRFSQTILVLLKFCIAFNWKSWFSIGFVWVLLNIVNFVFCLQRCTEGPPSNGTLNRKFNRKLNRNSLELFLQLPVQRILRAHHSAILEGYLSRSGPREQCMRGLPASYGLCFHSGRLRR